MTFPKLPIQWSENGYEITEELGHGSYGSVYKLVKDKGTENEEVSALKIINWTLDNNTVRYLSLIHILWEREILSEFHRRFV